MILFLKSKYETYVLILRTKVAYINPEKSLLAFGEDVVGILLFVYKVTGDELSIFLRT